MLCPQCRSENEADASFCTQCGTRLERPCPNCQAPNTPTARFCKRCGQALAPSPATAPPEPFTPPTSPLSYTPKHLAEKILSSRSALEGERKQVTVLFVDVSGFTSLSERLDPEDIHGVMQRGFEVMLTEVHRYEGTVNQFLGDGIMALFGAPIAHEDHAQRALHAALGIRKALEGYHEELQRRRGITFQVRQGLNTGLVVVGSIGTDLRMDYTAVGDTTNVAARLQRAADPGRIWISEATHRLAAGYFYTRPLGALSLKGKADPLPAWEVIAARQGRTRLEVEAERGLTPFVGRERELRLLTDCFEKAKAGHGQVVFLVGEPGIGKSRLLLEFRRRLGDEATWLEGHCMSFGRAIAFHSVIDLLKRNFRIEEGDTEGTIAKKIERGVLILGEDLRPTVPYLRYLLAADPGDPAVLTMAPQQRRGEIFDGLRRLMVRYFVLSEFERSRAEGERAFAIARRLGDRAKEGSALARMAWAAGWGHNFDQSLAYCRQAIEAASQVDAKPVLASAYLMMCWVHAVTARLEEAKQEMASTLASSEAAGDVLHQSLALSFSGVLANWEGDFLAATQRQTEALLIARRHNLLLPLMRILWQYSVTLIGKGDYDGALAALEEDGVLCEKAGDEITGHRILNTLGWLWMEYGNLERALDFNSRGADRARKRGDPETIANSEINLADAYLVKGDLTLARELLDGVHHLVKDPATSEWMKWRYSTHLFASLGEVWLARGDMAKAREFADQCLEIASRTNSRKYLVKGWRLKGGIATDRRQWEDAEAALREALTIAQAIANPTQLCKTHLTLGHLHAERKDREAARQAYQSAREVIDRVKANLRHPELRSSLETSAAIRRVYDLAASP